MIYPNFQEDYYLCNEKGQIPLWEPALLLINNIGLSESYVLPEDLGQVLTVPEKGSGVKPKDYGD